MYATIIQSAQVLSDSTQLPVRQWAIIPFSTSEGEHTVASFYRLGSGRGTSGAWIEGTREVYPDEVLLGGPVSVAITSNDLRDLRFRFPSTLLQKLVRATAADDAVPQTEPLENVLKRVREWAQSDPAQLAMWVRSGKRSETPAKPLKLVAEPVVPTAPAPVAVVTAAGSVADAYEPLLTALSVPKPEEVAHYVERTLPGELSETQVYEFARDNQQTVAIYGHAGTGKTSSARHIAAKWGVPFVQFECNAQVDEESIQGTFIPTGDPNRPLVWRYSELASAISQPSVILINESNRMPAKNAALFLGLLQERRLQVTRHRGETIDVHPECLIVTDANPGYRGTQASDQAFLDRLNIPVVFNYDRAIEETFIPSSTLLDLAEQMRRESETEDKWGIPISTRLLKNFVHHAKGLNLAFAIDAFVNSFPSEEEREALRILFDAESQVIASELGLTV